MRASVAGFVGQLRRCWRRPARRRWSSRNGSIAWIELALGHFESTSFSEAIETLEGRALLSAAGSLDATFGVGGLATTEFEPTRVALQSDGKIVVLGDSFLNSPLKLARYNENGTLDLTFGEGGHLIDDRSKAGASVAVQSDGKILVGSGSSRLGEMLTRYNKDGSADATFGNGGVVTTDFGPFHGSVHSIALQTDGKIIAAGSGSSALKRFDSDGSLDTTFGNGGQASTDFGSLVQITSVALQRDGKILVGGTSDGFVILARYNSDGSLDATFGTGGRVLESSLSSGYAAKVVLQTDDKIVVGGALYEETDTSPAVLIYLLLARYNTDGSLDSAFGNAGRVTVKSVGAAASIALQHDGKIVVATSVGDVLERYDANGSLDTTFGNGGRVASDFNSNGFYTWDMALNRDGTIVVVGNIEQRFVLARFNGEAVSGVVVVREGGSIPIANTELPTPPFDGSARSIIYTLAAAPHHGQLRLGSTRLRVNSTFTQADINAGRLSFRHDGSETTSDSFAYSIAGARRQSLPRQTFPIFVTPVNDPPVLARVSTSAKFTENAAPLFLARSATVTDPDTSNFGGHQLFGGGQLTVSITTNAEDSDRLTVQSSGTRNGQVAVADELSPPPGVDPEPPGSVWGKVVRFTSSGETKDIGMLFDGETPQGNSDRMFLSFNVLATREAVQAVLRQVAFQNTSDDPSPQARTVTITLTDGDGGTSNMTHTQVRMIPVDDRPRLEQFTSSINAVVAEPARRLMPQATMLDPDLKRLDGATLVVRGSPTASIVPGDGVWLVTATSTIHVDDRIVATVSHSGFQMSVRFNRNATSDDVTRVLRRVAVEASSTPGRRGTADVWFTDSNRVRSNVAHLTIHSISGRTASLEDVASLLKAPQITVTGVTVVVHGFQVYEPVPVIGGNGDALHPLARAIWERVDASNGDDAAWLLDDDVSPNGQHVFDTSPFDGQPVLPAEETPNQRGEVVLLFDWATDSNELGSGFGEANGQRLFELLRELGLVHTGDGATNTIPLHFIGHSFGAVVVSEAIERLARFKIQVDQVTYLDPHDFNQGLGFDGAQQLFTLGQPQFADGSQGYGATVWNNVAFADVYYETRPRSLIPNGRPILGAYNQLLNQRVGGVNPHGRVWDDFYLNTVIDVNELSSDTTNLGGYVYSRIAAGESQRPAPRFFDVSQDHRFTSRHLVAFNFVGQPIQINGHFVPGDQAPIAGDETPLASIRFAPL